MITDIERAKRLARTIIGDIVLYNKEKVIEGIKNDNVFDVLEEEINLGRKLFEEKVDTSIISPKIFDKTLIDILIAKYGKDINSKIW
ncbi:conserved hypothetical protein [Deferribacter desulfuricans SSM1]|uniref:Uncharacterized protein n=1 Tax=Deferribacter desulfuricans (strain DSM 14783 / JCM 11476 / NBRC 101012 / SSM1) TaxID=639282 RepID=D3PBM6_DEFDS|nr:hypothetical protein [Deferribacter desulfuricans]BAI79999.1 conserved hypothetical protein [Deferribacter desulfuricans SSM1]